MNIEKYYKKLGSLPLDTQVTSPTIKNMTIQRAFSEMAETIREAHNNRHTVWFVGNGGSSAISAHMAEDYTKNGNVRSMAFTDSSLLTCFANDYGYENMYAKAMEFYAKQGDILIAISSSGNSLNIIKSCEMAKKKKCSIFTFSGFSPDNKLRKLGKLNFWVPAEEYGFVELTHIALLHGVLDLHLGGK